MKSCPIFGMCIVANCELYDQEFRKCKHYKLYLKIKKNSNWYEHGVKDGL